MIWKPRIRLGATWGAVTLGAMLLFGTWCVQRARNAPVDLSLFFLVLAAVICAVLAVLIGYLLYGLLTLSYTLDRNGLVIRWGHLRQIVPMDRIERVTKGEDVRGSARFWGVVWPGYRVGRGRIAGIGSLRAYATRPLAEQLLVVTASEVYGISPSDPHAFLADLGRRRGLGVVRQMDQMTLRAKWASLPILADRWAHLLMLIGFLLNAGLFAYVCYVYPGLPRILSLHFDALGEVDRVGARSELFALPLIGLISEFCDALVGLLLHRRQTTGAYLLLMAGILVQILLWAGAVSIVS